MCINVIYLALCQNTYTLGWTKVILQLDVATLEAFQYQPIMVLDGSDTNG